MCVSGGVFHSLFTDYIKNMLSPLCLSLVFLDLARSSCIINQSINHPLSPLSLYSTPLRPCNLLYTSLVNIFPAFFIVSTLGMNIYTLRGRPLHYPCHFIIKLSSSVQHYLCYHIIPYFKDGGGRII